MIVGAIRTVDIAPLQVDGIAFHCVRAGAARYEWRSEDGRFTVGRTSRHGMFYVARERYPLPARFASLDGALRFAAASCKAERRDAPAAEQKRRTG